MIASVHLVDTSMARNLTRRMPKPAKVPGLLWAGKAMCGQLSSGARPDIDLGRGGMIAWWDDDDALEAWLADDPKAADYNDGFQLRLRPLRTRAEWPGGNLQIESSDEPPATALHVATTLGKAHPRTAYRFLKISGELEEQFLEDPSGLWGIGISILPRIVMTLTIWESKDATDAFVGSGAHGEAMKNHYDFPTDTHEFVAPGGFFGFEPYMITGSLGGKNPTPPGLADRVAG